MNRSPEVTIITITRNRASLLARAIKSVLNQTYKSFEYIIIDGASTDDTTKIVHSFNDNRIIYIKQGYNINPTISIDDAVELSKGKYITFLDDDDEYLPTKIEKQINLFKNLSEEYGLVYCWMDYYDEKSNKLVKEHHPSNRGYIFYDCIEKQSMGGTPTLFMRRGVYFDVKGWNKNLKYITDWEFNTRIARKYLIDFVPEVLVKVYISHSFERQTTSQLKLDKLNNIYNQIEFHNYYLREFSEGFEKYPIKKSTHLERLARLYARLGLLKDSFSKIIELYKLGIRKYLFIQLFLKCSILSIKSIFNKNEA